jgi:hypothetical protein
MALVVVLHGEGLEIGHEDLGHGTDRGGRGRQAARR